MCPTVKPQWARPNTDHQAPANLTESFMPEASLSLRPDLPSGSAIKEVCIVVSRDWVNLQACSLSHNIHVGSDSFVTNDKFPKLIRKIISIKQFS